MKKLMLIISMIIVVAACQGTGSAYKAAVGLDQNAKVVAEHYYSLVREANDLKTRLILTGGELVKAQDLVRSSRPAIDRLIEASQAYEGLQDATTEAELSQAIADAAIAISSLIDIILAARDSSQIKQNPGFGPFSTSPVIV
jgi:hypothetical protein